MIHKHDSKMSLRGLVMMAMLLAVTMTPATLPSRVSAQENVKASSSTTTIKNFGKVDDHYYRGSQPAANQVEELKRLGVKTVIDLRKDKVENAGEWVKRAGLQYFNIPLLPGRAATDEETAYFMTLVNDPANWPVYVHCKGGRHRTGALTAVYRITHDGWTAAQAWEEMKRYDFNDGLFGGPAAQKKFVFRFYEKHTNNHGNK